MGKLQCESIVEDLEEDVTTLLSEESNDDTLGRQLCYERSKLCRDKTKSKQKAKEEL